MSIERKTARGTAPKRGMNGLREAAIILGEKFYNTGMPCARGHFAPRRTSNSICTECEKINRDTYRKTDKYEIRRRASYERSYAKDPTRFIYDRAMGRARRKNLLFDLTHEYVKSLWPEDGLCPAIGIPLIPNVGGGNQNHNSPSLDKIDPNGGYVVGNVAIISTLANQMKADGATPDLLRKLASWLESLQ